MQTLTEAIDIISLDHDVYDDSVDSEETDRPEEAGGMDEGDDDEDDK